MPIPLEGVPRRVHGSKQLGIDKLVVDTPGAEVSRLDRPVPSKRASAAATNVGPLRLGDPRRSGPSFTPWPPFAHHLRSCLGEPCKQDRKSVV